MLNKGGRGSRLDGSYGGVLRSSEQDGSRGVLTTPRTHNSPGSWLSRSARRR